MIILDTNVISSLIRDPPEAIVLAWLDRQDQAELVTTAINVLELRFGILTMAHGRRRRTLESALEAVLNEDLDGRILSFDDVAAEVTAALEARRKALGRPFGTRDAQIAGIAIANGAGICTRNVRHFDDAGAPLHNPWG